MRKPVIVVVDWSTALAYEGQKGAMSLKVNDEVCACNCGMKFKGGTIANKAGNCACAPQGKSEGKVIQSA
jgi:hypothetical protein